MEREKIISWSCEITLMFTKTPSPLFCLSIRVVHTPKGERVEIVKADCFVCAGELNDSVAKKSVTLCPKRFTFISDKDEQMKKDSLEKKIAAYVTLAAAYLAAHPVDADAQILYTNVNPDVHLVNSTFFNLDLNNDGIVDFHLHGDNGQFNNGGSSGSAGFSGSAYIDALSSNEIIGIPPVMLNALDTISQNNNWGQSNLLVNDYFHQSWGYTISGSWVNSSSTTSGNWQTADNNYLGLKIKVGIDIYYGWARLSGNGYNGFIIKDYAFFNSPNHPILAGETDCASNTEILVSPDTIVCDGNPISLSVLPSVSDSIKWSDGISVFGVNSYSFAITQSGSYYSIFTYPLCKDTSVEINLYFLPNPADTIFYLNDTLMTVPSSNNHYQWYYGTNPINNSDYYFHIPNQTGNYKVRITNQFGCIVFSDYLHIQKNNVGVELTDLQNELSLSLTNKIIHIYLPDNSLLGNQIEIINELGQMVTTVTITNQNPEADLSALPGGIYFFHIRSKQKTYSGKFFIE